MSTRSRTDNLGHLEETQKTPTFLLYKDGHTVRNYRLIERVGEGSYGEVWKAERDGVAVALKILKTTLNSEDSRRVLKSLETLKELQHPFLLNASHYWSDGDRLYIEMELADGGSLKELLIACKNQGRKGIPKEELLWHFAGIAEALDFLHTHQPITLHRDIKPGNILLVGDRAKLADFDLLRQVSADHTSTSTQGGTPVYMAPESIERNVFSPQTDLFSLAVTYVELRQGRLPFTGATAFQICKRILHEPPELADLFDAEEKTVLLRALAKDPRHRFGRCGAFVEELKRVVPWTAAPLAPRMSAAVEPRLDSWNEGTTRAPAPSRRPVLMLMAVLLLAAVGGGSWWHAHTEAKAQVQQRIDDRQFEEAYQAVNRHWLALPLRDGLDDEIAQKWWADLKEPAPDAGLQQFSNDLDALHRFRAVFPRHEAANARLAQSVQHVETRVDELLQGRRFKEASDLVEQIQASLPERSEPLRMKIDKMWRVNAASQVAQKRMAAAWSALAADPIALADARRLLDEASKASSEPQHARPLAALRAALAVHDAPQDRFGDALAGVVAELRQADASTAAHLWQTLIHLERRRGVFCFEDLASLDRVQANPATSALVTKLVGDVLERLVRREGWYPASGADRQQCARWCERVPQPSPWIQALQAECVLASNQSAPLGPWPDAGGYGAYVHALAVHQNAKLPGRNARLQEAVHRLVPLLRSDPKSLKGVDRLKNVAIIVQSALASLPRKDRAFVTAEDAEKASAWLDLLWDWPGQEFSPTQVIDLAFAGARRSDLAQIRRAANRLEASEFPPAEQAEAHYSLAKAYSAQKTAARLALAHFDQALKAADKDAERRKIAADAAEFAYQLADVHMGDSQKNWTLAIDYCKRCQHFAHALKGLDLDSAARLHGNAVRLQAVAVYNAKGGHKEKSKNALEYYRVLEDALPGKAMEAFCVPVMVEKLKWAPVRKDHLESNIALGESAIAVARKQADDPARTEREFWDKLTCDGLVYLAMARGDLLASQIEKKELQPDRAKDRPALLRSYTQMLASLHEARTRKRYTEKWPGELAFRIGHTHYQASMLLRQDDRKKGQSEAELAYRELRLALKIMPDSKGAAVVQDARSKIDKARSELEREYPSVSEK